MQRIVGVFIALYIGSKIGNEMFRYKNPGSGYKPPSFFSWRILPPSNIKRD